jgi:hypothetical protein
MARNSALPVRSGSQVPTAPAKRKFIHRSPRKPTSIRLSGDGRFALDRRLKVVCNELLHDMERRGIVLDATAILRARSVARVLVRLEIVDAQSREGLVVNDFDLQRLTRLANSGLERLGLSSNRKPKAPPKPVPSLGSLVSAR